MAFHEVQFPTNVSYGSHGGPGFSTDVVVVDSGAEQRVPRWNQARRRYNAAYGVKTYADLCAVQEFYVARRGIANGFRYRDFLDCTTSANGLAPELGGASPTPLDEQIGTGNGAAINFQLVKRYQFGAGGTTVRNITKPVDGTVRIAVNGTEQTLGWTVNTTTGIVTFTIVPGNGHIITAGCQFDVPVRFGEELDEALAVSIDNFSSGSINDIPLVELVDGTEVEDEFFFGGASTITFGAAITLSMLQGRCINLKPTAAADVILPNNTGLPGGGPYFYLANTGTFGATIKDHLGAVLVVLPVNAMAIIVLSVDAGSGARQWFALQ